MSVEKSMHVADRLRSVSMNATAYQKAPAGAGNFILGNPNAQGIRVWVPELSDVQIALDKKRHQAVLNLHEDERTMTASTPARLAVAAPKTVKALQQIIDDRSVAESFIEKATTPNKLKSITNPVQVTNPKKVSRSMGWSSRSKNSAIAQIRNQAARIKLNIENRNYSFFPGNLSFSAPVKFDILLRGQDLSFLVGIDETAHFVAQLPTKVSTVAEAHEALKPKGWKENWVRQGEWFFAPVGKTLSKTLNGMPANTTHKSVRNYVYSGTEWRKNRVNLGHRLEANSSHYVDGLYVTYANETYVKGVIKDDRTHHHHDLELDGWHKVVRNREVVMTTAQAAVAPRQRRYWD